jgi:hypothetical protein
LVGSRGPLVDGWLGHIAANLRRDGTPITLKFTLQRDVLSALASPLLNSLSSESTMKLSVPLLSLAIAMICSVPISVQAQESQYDQERASARRDLYLAKVDLRNYWQIEYPRIRRQLNAQIDLTEAEVRIYKERLRLFRPFDRFSTGSAVTWSLQDLRMCLMEAELRLRDLWAERNNLVRFRTAEWRELELRVHDARVLVAEIEAARENAANEAELPAR